MTWASEQNFSSFHQQTDFKVLKYEITEFSEIKNWNLKKYLWSRGLSQKVYPYIKEIKFTMNGKKLYAIGFENQSGGWELRNSFYKGSIMKKDISIIKSTNNEKTFVFEGFFDALSFIELQDLIPGNILVLNSISLIDKAKEFLKTNKEVCLFLDNDEAGLKCKNTLKSCLPNVKDFSQIYENHKDFNQYFISEKPKFLWWEC